MIWMSLNEKTSESMLKMMQVALPTRVEQYYLNRRSLKNTRLFTISEIRFVMQRQDSAPIDSITTRSAAPLELHSRQMKQACTMGYSPPMIAQIAPTKKVLGEVNFENKHVIIISIVPMLKGRGTTPFSFKESARLLAQIVRIQWVPLDLQFTGHRSMHPFSRTNFGSQQLQHSSLAEHSAQNSVEHSAHVQSLVLTGLSGGQFKRQVHSQK